MSLTTAPEVIVDYGEFTPENILDQAEENRLKNLFTTPSYIPIIDVRDEFNRRYGAEQRAIQEQVRQDYEAQKKAIAEQQEQAKYALARRGLYGSPYGEKLYAPIREAGEYQMGIASDRLANAVEESRMERIANLRNQLSSQMMRAIGRQFEKQQKAFARDFVRYQNTTQAKYSKELRENARRIQDESKRAWEQMELAMQRQQRGWNIGGKVVGGLAALIALIASHGNTELASSLYQLGSGAGQTIGASRAKKVAYKYF